MESDDPSASKKTAPKNEPANPLPDLIRRVATVGLSGFFTTEEALRRALGDTLPKDWVDFAADQSERARSDFADRITQELRHAVETTDLADVIAKLLSGKTVEINARIRLVDEEADAGSSDRPAPRAAKKTPAAKKSKPSPKAGDEH